MKLVWVGFLKKVTWGTSSPFLPQLQFDFLVERQFFLPISFPFFSLDTYMFNVCFEEFCVLQDILKNNHRLPQLEFIMKSIDETTGGQIIRG